jgi:hypothetical protein
MVSVLAIGPKNRGFKPAEVDKNQQHVRFYGMLKNSLKYEQKYSVRQNSFPPQVPPALRLDNSAGRIARDLCCANQEISPVDIIPPWFSMLIYHMGVNNRPFCGRSSET